MSVLKLAAPIGREFALSLAQPRHKRHPLMVLVSTISLGALVISLLGLLLNVATSQGVYELAKLKSEKKNLAETTQILGAEVSSLASAQNLSNAAQEMGMVANANPVFLSIQSQKVLGKPMAAIASSAERITKNLVPNALLTTETTAQDLAAADVVTGGIVAPEASSSTLVINASATEAKKAPTSTAKVSGSGINAQAKPDTKNVVTKTLPKAQVGFSGSGISSSSNR